MGAAETVVTPANKTDAVIATAQWASPPAEETPVLTITSALRDNEPSIQHEDRPCPGHSSCGGESAGPPGRREMNKMTRRRAVQKGGHDCSCAAIIAHREVPSWDPAGGA